jgi:protocatechuate 3,4-dioxygenase beta subunit
MMRTMSKGRRLAVAAGALLALGSAGALVFRACAAGPSSSGARAGEARLELIVTAPGGGPAARAEVALSSGKSASKQRTDAGGRARFGPLAPGRAELVVTHAGAAQARKALTLTAGDNRARVALVAPAPIQGVVVDDAGAAIAGAEVEAQAETAGAPAFAARSDAQGRFLIDGLAPGTYGVRVSTGRHELAVLPTVEAPTREPVRVVLQRTAALRGQVLDGSGRPAAGAGVTIAGSGVWPPKQLHSDAQGRFELRPVPSGIYELRARRDTWVAPPQEGVVIEPAAEVAVTLRLEPGAALRGRVFDAERGTPLAQLAVTSIEDALSGAPLSATTGEDGRFAFEGLRAVPHRIWIYAPGYVAVAGEAREPAAEPHEFALRRAAVLEGSVVDERGAAMAAVELEVTGTADTGGPLRVSAPPGEGGGPPDLTARVLPPAGDNLGVVQGRVPKVPLFAAPLDLAQDAPAARPALVTDAAGRFRIEGVPAGKVQVVARHPGYAPSRSAQHAIEAGARLADLRIVLARGATLLGRLVDADEYPVASVLVQLELEGEPAPRATVSGEDGRFRFEAVRGRCAITAHPAGAPPVREQLELASGEQRELVLRTAGAGRELAGRVVDARGFPVGSAQVRVSALDARFPANRAAHSAADGTFRVAGLPDPPYAVEVEHADYAATRLRPVSPESGAELRVELHAGARVHGLVLDRLKNEGIAGAQVRLRGAGDPRSTRTDKQGEFEFSNVSTGKYEIIVDSDRHISGRATLALADSGSRELDPIVLGPGGSLSGDVVDRLGAPVFDAEVALGAPAQWKRSVRTDHRGHFRLTGIEPGEHWVSARHGQAGQSLQPAPIRVYALQESPGIVLRLPGQLAAQ